MIDLQTDLDHLNMLAADSAVSDAYSADIRAAAVDIKNLKEYVDRLERDIWAADGADDIINSLDRRIDRAISRRLETENASDETVREIVKDMIRDGAVTVSLDYSNVELELSLEV